ncbi:hypothetical protein [Pontimicrobium sp. MEBiC01747]
MEDNRKQLMKHFATVLKNLSLGKTTDNMISENLVHYFSRKALLEMVHKRFNGKIPKEINLVEAEKQDLLSFIGNELYIITYTVEKWCKEIQKEEPKDLGVKKNPPFTTEPIPDKKEQPKKTTAKNGKTDK